MGMFDKIQKTAKNVGSTVTKTAGKVGSNAAVATQEQAELVSLRSQVNVINQELESAYTQIGRKFVNYVVESGEMPGIDVSDILKMIDPKMTKKQDLEQKIIQLEKEIKQKDIVREKAAAEEEFLAQKQKLDKALGMDLLSQEEYDEKIAVARKRVDNFEAIRRVEQQAEMGLITEQEKNDKIIELTT
ncbi:hypothetical protein [uncultured Ruminococcus sp.]|uniref:hypothetical protein n=1 Tax=uncultured Ruminococcus sp. TaxID=165186 RepID=UPI00262B2E16|nr:hypothetical protein [uncultured Ruminococcus sp.]